MFEMEFFRPLSTGFLSLVSMLDSSIAHLIDTSSLTFAELMTSFMLLAGVRPTDRLLASDREWASCYNAFAS